MNVKAKATTDTTSAIMDARHELFGWLDNCARVQPGKTVLQKMVRIGVLNISADRISEREYLCCFICIVEYNHYVINCNTVIEAT